MTSRDQHTEPEPGERFAPTAQEALNLGETAVQAVETNLCNLLTKEQQVYAGAVIDTLVEDLGLDREDVRLILEASPERGKRVLAMDASPNGQFIGLYRDILAKREDDPGWYTIFLDGQRIDPLAECNKVSYEAMIIDARKRGEQFLPDSLALNQHNGHVWTATMMTGEPLESEGHIWIGSSSSYDKVNFVGNPIDRGGKSFRVRPAVVVARLENQT